MDGVFAIYREGVSEAKISTLRLDLLDDDLKLATCLALKQLLEQVPGFSLVACVSESQEIIVTRDEWRSFLATFGGIPS